MSSSPVSLPTPTAINEKAAKRAKPGKSKSTEKKVTQPKGRPSRALPTDRITFERQLDILRAYAAASDNGTKPTSTEAVAEVVKMAPSTVAMANPFFTSLGLLQRTDAGFIPAPEVVNFLRAYGWNTETAPYKLGPLIESAWFSQTLIPKLRFGTIEQEQAITDLADAASAGPDSRKQLRILLDYMVTSGLVQRDGSVLKLAAAPDGASASSSSEPPMSTEPTVKNRVLTAFTQTPEGSVNFNVQVRVDMTEFSNWEADRIAAFFAGIAQVLAAKARIEKEAGS
jgi:hypothetical protein